MSRGGGSTKKWATKIIKPDKLEALSVSGQSKVGKRKEGEELPISKGNENEKRQRGPGVEWYMRKEEEGVIKV